MKHLMPIQLIMYLQRTANNVRADLFTLNLPNGQTLCATDAQFDITVPSTTPGWTGSTTTWGHHFRRKF
jgi:hypothetical protein